MDKTILIVDDSPPVRKLLETTFSKRGYKITTAENAEAALGILAQKRFGVMFFDMNMPGMSGLELCEKIRKDHPLSFIYAMTAYVSVFALTECRGAGFDDYFVKPINIPLFEKAVQEAFEKINRWRKKNN